MFEGLISIRDAHDLTQNDIANIIGVTRTVISKWESGKVIIPLSHLNDYANYFNVSLDYLVGITRKMRYDDCVNNLNKKLIGKRIKEFRKKNNLSIRKLAKELNTTPSTISAYENGKVLILTIFAYQIALKYSISMDWLIGRADKMYIINIKRLKTNV